VRRGGGAAVALYSRGDALDDFEVHVGRAQRQAASPTGALGAQQHIRQNRDGGAPLDDALHMAQRRQERRPFDGEIHLFARLLADRT